MNETNSYEQSMLVVEHLGPAVAARARETETMKLPDVIGSLSLGRQVSLAAQVLYGELAVGNEYANPKLQPKTPAISDEDPNRSVLETQKNFRNSAAVVTGSDDQLTEAA